MKNQDEGIFSVDIFKALYFKLFRTCLLYCKLCGTSLQTSQTKKWMDIKNIQLKADMVPQIHVENSCPGACGLLFPALFSMQVL